MNLCVIPARGGSKRIKKKILKIFVKDQSWLGLSKKL
jgi:CMP-N-acetylneuraminic acid synthetase